MVSNDSGRPSIFSDDYKKNQFKTSLNNYEKCKILQQPSAVKNLWRRFSSKTSDDSEYDYKIGRFISDKDSGVEKSQYTETSSSGNFSIEQASTADTLDSQIELEDVSFDDLEVVPVKIPLYRKMPTAADHGTKIRVNARFINLISNHMKIMTQDYTKRQNLRQVVRITATGIKIYYEKKPMPLNMRFIEFMSKTISRIHQDCEVKCIAGINQEFIVKNKRNKNDSILEHKKAVTSILRKAIGQDEFPRFVEHQGLLFKVRKKKKAIHQ